MKQPRPFSCLDSRTPRPARGAKKRQRPRIGLDRRNAKTLGELELVAPDLVEEAVGVAAPNKQFNGLFYLLGDYPVDDHAPPGFLLGLGMCGCQLSVRQSETPRKRKRPAWASSAWCRERPSCW